MLLGNLFEGRMKRSKTATRFDYYNSRPVSIFSDDDAPDIEAECVDSAPYGRDIDNLSIRVSMGYDGLITDVDNNMEIATGYSRRDIIETSFAEWLVESDETKEFFELLLRDGWVYGYPLHIKRPDGNIVHVICAATIIMMFAGSAGGRNED